MSDGFDDRRDHRASRRSEVRRVLAAGGQVGGGFGHRLRRGDGRSI